MLTGSRLSGVHPGAGRWRVENRLLVHPTRLGAYAGIPPTHHGTRVVCASLYTSLPWYPGSMRLVVHLPPWTGSTIRLVVPNIPTMDREHYAPRCTSPNMGREHYAPRCPSLSHGRLGALCASLYSLPWEAGSTMRLIVLLPRRLGALCASLSLSGG